MERSEFFCLDDRSLQVLELLEAPVHIYSFSTKRIVWANRAGLKFWSAESLPELQAHDLLPFSTSASACPEAYLAAFRRGEHRMESWTLYPNGMAVAAGVHCRGVSLAGHDEAMLLEIRAQEPIDMPACELRAIEALRQFPGMVSMVGDDGAALLRNPGALAFLSRCNDGEPGAAIFADDTARQNFLAAIEAKGSCTQIARLTVDGGRSFWAVVQGTRLMVDEDQAVLLIIRDIDELQQVMTELETALEVEREVSEAQRRALEIASHEFRTHLAVIDSAAQRIARQAGKVPPAHDFELATRIRNYVGRLKGLLDQTIERTEDHLAAVRYEGVRGHIQDAIREVAETFSDRADIEVDDEIANIPEMWFDPVWMERALINLVDNAIKYSPERARIRFSVVIGVDSLELYIRDWGIGIPPEQREDVFAKCARGANVGQLPGSGLGLYIVRSTIRAHGGEISIAETRGPGTTLKLLLPFGQPISQPVTQDSTGD